MAWARGWPRTVGLFFVLPFIYKPLHAACRCLEAAAAFQNDHILSQIETIDPSRAPISFSP